MGTWVLTMSAPVSKTTECVACAEDILSKAKLCKHCGTMQSDPTFAPVKSATKKPTPALESKSSSQPQAREATETELDMLSALILIWNPEEFDMDDDELANSWNLSKSDIQKIQKWQKSTKGEDAMFALMEQIKSGFVENFSEFLNANPRFDTSECRDEISEFVKNQDFSQSTKFVSNMVSSLFEDDPKTGLIMYMSFNDFEDWLEPKTWTAVKAFLKEWWHQGASHLVARAASGFNDPISRLPY
jgi:hypothetical protein